MRRSIVLATALALDLALGEPPARIHPVVWFGRLVALKERRAVRGGARRDLASGVALALLSLGTVWLAARTAETLLAFAKRSLALAATPRLGTRLSSCLAATTAVLAEAWLVKTTLSLRALTEAASEVQRALVTGDLQEARKGLRSLVSRDTSDLVAPLLAAATIESVAENASDSLVAPMLAYVACGLPGAAVYRSINTLDAMVGYHGAYEWYGKPSARLDDIANLIPSRLTAALLILAAGLRRGRSAGQVAWRDHGTTASPNAGWPMSAMAGALGVELEKAGQYRLGAPARLPEARDIDTAIGLVRRVTVLSAVAVHVANALTGDLPLRRQTLDHVLPNP